MVKEYRKGQLIVLAVEFTADNFDLIEEFTNGLARDFQSDKRINAKQYCYLKTEHGVKAIPTETMVVKTHQGEIFSWNKDLFKKQFDVL